MKMDSDCICLIVMIAGACNITPERNQYTEAIDMDRKPTCQKVRSFPLPCLPVFPSQEQLARAPMISLPCVHGPQMRRSGSAMPRLCGAHKNLTNPATYGDMAFVLAAKTGRRCASLEVLRTCRPLRA